MYVPATKQHLCGGGGKGQDTEEHKNSTMINATYVAAVVGKRACLGTK